MKKILAILMCVFLIVSLAACGNTNNSDNDVASQSANENTVSESLAESSELSDESPDAQSAETPSEAFEDEQEAAKGKTLVVYYSASGNTENIANYIAAATDADLFELEPVEPYSDEDLNWRDRNSRVVYEHNNKEARVVELVTTTVPNWESYDTVFVGYPIWWQIASWVLDGFIADNDFTGKTVIPFCTSTSSGLGESGELLAEAAGTGNWLEGERFRERASEADVQAWVESLDL